MKMFGEGGNESKMENPLVEGPELVAPDVDIEQLRIKEKRMIAICRICQRDSDICRHDPDFQLLVSEDDPRVTGEWKNDTTLRENPEQQKRCGCW